MAITEISTRGRAFVRLHEGNPLTCYLDPVKIPTIGTGFTMRSDSCKAEFAKLGITKLVPGKTKITAEQSDKILDAIMAAEYVPAVVKGSPENRKQHQLDAAASACFNLGTGAMGWEWAKLWRSGKIADAAAYLGSHYNTAAGRKLAGLVRRRKEESAMFASGVYTGVTVSTPPEGVPRSAIEKKPALQDPVVREAQEILTAKGFNPGAIDGWMGEKTAAAVKEYQRAHPHLTADGVIGTATLTQLRRDAAALKEAVTKGAGSGVGAAVTAWSAGLPWGWIAVGVAVAVVAYVAYRNRDLIQRWINTKLGRETVV